MASFKKTQAGKSPIQSLTTPAKSADTNFPPDAKWMASRPRLPEVAEISQRKIRQIADPEIIDWCKAVGKATIRT